MISFILGLVFIAFTVFACLPIGLDWGSDVVNFLKGFAPVLTAFIGLIAVFIGFGDIRDKHEAKKEEKTAQLQKESETTAKSE